MGHRFIVPASGRRYSVWGFQALEGWGDFHREIADNSSNALTADQARTAFREEFSTRQIALLYRSCSRERNLP